MHNLKNVYRGSFGAHALIQCRQYATSRSKTYYNVLGVSKTATQKEIKSAYIDLSKKHHPDTAGSKSKKKFTEINEAYSVLSKPLSRKEYDNKIAFESSSSINYGPHGPKYRPPGSGPASYPPPGYRYGESYWQDDSAYTEYQRERMEALRKAREKIYEERIRQFKEFEQRAIRVKRSGQQTFLRFLGFYIRAVFFGSLFIMLYAVTNPKPPRPFSEDEFWKAREKVIRENIRQFNKDFGQDKMKWRQGIIRKTDFFIFTLMLLSVLILSNGGSNDYQHRMTGWRNYRVKEKYLPWIRLAILIVIFMFQYSISDMIGDFLENCKENLEENSQYYPFYLLQQYRSELFHGVISLLFGLGMFFVWWIETREEFWEFYRRKGFYPNEQELPRMNSENRGQEWIEALAGTLLIIIVAGFAVFRIMIFTKAHEARERRSRYHSDLHWRYEYFYGEHGKENRERARASEAGYRSEEQQKKDFRRIVNGVLIAALIITILRFFAERQITTRNEDRFAHQSNRPQSNSFVPISMFVILCIMGGFVVRKTSWHKSRIKKLDVHRQFDVSRSPSDDMKRNINKTVLEEKDITPPVK